MGIFPSKESPEPEGPPALLSTPWSSHIKWTRENREQLLEEINNFRVKGGIQYLNCLLLGQAASGKTSFFNTCSTALKDGGRIKTPLTVFKSSGGSVTTKFETHPLYTKRDEVLKLRIYDCRGLHDIKGVTAEDIRRIADGHVKQGYTINPVSPISRDDPLYRENPGRGDMMHCVVYVVNAENPGLGDMMHCVVYVVNAENPGLGDMMHCVVYVVNAENPGAALAGDAAEKIFSDIRVKLGEKHVPQLVLMSKVDRLRASLADDISDLFRSAEVKKKFEIVANFMKLPGMNVLPMSNYHNEAVPNTNKDILALYNLKTIMDCANDFVRNDVPPDFYN